jgi:hypothetical protein
MVYLKYEYYCDREFDNRWNSMYIMLFKYGLTVPV